MINSIDLLAEKDTIVEVINNLFIGTDNRDWFHVRGCFAKSVEFDMTSMTGGQPSQLTPDQITEAWDKALKPIEQLHHQAGNYQVTITGSSAEAFCYGTAFHYRKTTSGKNLRTFVGSYEFRLKKDDFRWLINRFKFNLKFVEGNPDLEKS